MRHLLIFLSLGCFVAAQAQVQRNAPNILILLADDLGWNDVGYRNPKRVTPVINKLAKEGLDLQRFYTYPVCSPARAALLSGIMPRRFGIVDVMGPGQQGIPKTAVTLPAKLKSLGYQTSLIGKWHLGNNNAPTTYGFDHFYGFLSAELDYFKHTDKRGKPDWQRDGKQIEEVGYTTYLFADDAVKQIKARDKSRPFFLQVAFNAPHVDLAAPAELIEKHKSDGLYGAVVEGLDIGIGRVLAALDEQGIRNNTLVIFCSDNGAPQRSGSNLPLNNFKATIYEGGIRTPAIVRWPGHTPVGVATQHAVAMNDLYPTLLHAIGLPLGPDAKLDGVSQWQAISSGKPIERTSFLIASHDIALFDGDWKLIEFGDGKRSLYNLSTDISETKDEWAKQPELAAKLGAKLDELKKGLPAAPDRQMGGPGGGKKGGGKGTGGKGATK
ncbi:MAG: sulfatase-like hydrolase/transferase [Verrucomicrobiota bacterium]